MMVHSPGEQAGAMYTVKLEIRNEDMRFLQARARLYGKENATQLLQALVLATIRAST